MDFVTCVGCAAHDGSNALKWSAARHTSEDVTMDTFIAIESLQNSFCEITHQVFPFIMRVLAFQDDCYDNEQVERIWMLLDIESDWMELFLRLDPAGSWATLL